jgi:DNA-directed RNA polymerase subunit RPC12/RpoP
VIGGVSDDPQGRGPCTCVKYEPTTNQSDTVSMPAPPQESTGAAAGPAKVCMACGKNLAGHRRVKDSRGYLCYDCAKSEIQTERDGTVTCAECGKRLKPDGLVPYEGIKICKKCFNDHKERQKFEKKVATSGYQEQEKKSLIILSIVFGILGVIILLKTFVFK